MKLLNYLKLFLGIASIEAKRTEGERVFESVILVLPRALEDTNDEQLRYFKSVIVPTLSDDKKECLQEYLKWMILLNRPEGCCSYREEQYYSKWESVYSGFLEALSEE